MRTKTIELIHGSYSDGLNGLKKSIRGYVNMYLRIMSYLYIVSVSGVPKCNLSSSHSMFLSSNGGVLELIHIPQPSNKLLMKILQPKKIVQVLDGPTISTSNDRMVQKIRKTKKEGTRNWGDGDLQIRMQTID